MHHTQANFGAINSAALVTLNALQDTGDFVQNNNIVLRKPYNLVGVYVSGATLARARMNIPYLQMVSNIEIRPITAALLPPTDPNIYDLRRSPLQLRPNEELNMVVANSAGGAENTYAVSTLHDGNFTPPAGPIYCIRCTGSAAAVASTWTSTQLALANTLPDGDYAIVGMDFFSTTAIAARLVLPGQFERPGCLGTALAGSRTHDMFYPGRLGVWGYFRSNILPQAQVLCNAADAAAVQFFDIWVVKIN